MRKFLFAVIFFVNIFAVNVCAQTFKERTYFELTAGSGLRYKGISPKDFSFRLNVDLVPITYIFIAVDDNILLYKNDGVNTYYNGYGIGGGLGFKLFNRLKSKHAIDIRVKSLSSLGCSKWKRNTYDVSIAWYLKSEKFSPVVELGYRYLDSRTKGFSNYGNAYMSIGLRY